MNTIDILGEEETFRNIVERTITEFEDSEIKVIGSNAFNSCSKLTSVSLPKGTSFKSSTLMGTALRTLYIGTELDTVCTLDNVFGIPNSVTGIYVPEKLVDSYKTAKNWSYFADKIKAYTGV